MSVLIAIAHIGASIFVLVVLGGIALWIGTWHTERAQRRRLEEIAVSLGVPIEDLDKPELGPRILELSSNRFSSELLRNRLSDLCGLLQTVWSWLGSLVQLCVLVGVAWSTFTADRENAVFAWSVVPIGLFFWLSGIAFSLACHLFTGRYPGEAKRGRKELSAYVQAQHHQLEFRDAV